MYDLSRHSLDRHATYRLAAYLAGTAPEQPASGELPAEPEDDQPRGALRW